MNHKHKDFHCNIEELHLSDIEGACCILQALLLWGQMALFYWYTMTLFWSPATGAAAKTHLRILIAIKSLYFTFSAMQLRNGYPPPASYRQALGQAFACSD